MRHRDEDAHGPSEVKHENHQTAGEQGDGQNAGEPRVRLVGEPVEDGGDRGDVERARGGDDEEHGEHVRRAPDDLIAHAGDDVAVLFHIERGAKAERQERDMQPDEPPEEGGAILEPSKRQLRHRCANI